MALSAYYAEVQKTPHQKRKEREHLQNSLRNTADFKHATPHSFSIYVNCHLLALRNFMFFSVHVPPPVPVLKLILATCIWRCCAELRNFQPLRDLFLDVLYSFRYCRGKG